MNHLDAALQLAEAGYAVFPCKPNDNVPHGKLAKNGCKNATTDPELIRKWWTTEPSANIGVECSGLIVIDCDTGHNWQGATNLAFVDCLQQMTPSGGEHYIFKRPNGHDHWKNSVGKIAPRIDTRTTGGYIVVAPSVRASGAYQWFGDVVDAKALPEPPAWLVGELDKVFTPKPAPPPVSVPPLPIADDDFIYHRASEYIRKTDPAIEGKGGHNTTFRVASSLVNGFQLDDAQAFQLMREYSETCEPPWDEKDIRHKITQARAAGPPADKVAGWLRNEVQTPTTTSSVPPKKEPLPRPLWVNVGHYLDTEPPPLDPIADSVFECGDKLLIIGPSKCRKSFYAMQASMSIALGVDFLDWQIPKPRRVAVMNLEIKETHFHRRLRRVAESMGVTAADLGGRMVACNGRGKAIDLNTLPEVDLLVIDPLYKLLTAQGLDENLATDLGKVLLDVDRFIADTGAAVAIVHHDPKGHPGDRSRVDRGSGSGVLARDYDAAVLLAPHANEEDAIVVDTVVRNYAPRESFTAIWDFGSFRTSAIEPTAETSLSAAHKKQAGPSDEELLDFAADLVNLMPMTTTDAQNGLRAQKNIGQDRAKRIIKLLATQDGFDRWRETGFGGKFFIGRVVHKPSTSSDIS